jgi:predicted negative regulator of RcsB-dependent stress response
MDILVNMRRFFRVTTIGLTAVILLIGSFFVFNNYLYQEKQSDGVAPVQYQATLEGEYV